MGALLAKLSRLSVADESSSKKEVFNFTSENLKTPCRTFIADQLLDPRSATQGIKRTPIILLKFEENNELNTDTPVKPKPYLETDLDEVFEAKECNINSAGNRSQSIDDNTPDDDSLNALHKSDSLKAKESMEEIDQAEEVEEQVEELAKEIADKVINDEEIITVDGKIMNSPAVVKVKKTFVFEDDSPTSESTPVKPKNGRTPLALVSRNSSPLPSPLGAGSKPWRGIHEERVRLGLENTPPHSGPFLESVQSAPGKVGMRRVKKSFVQPNWAQDESLVI